MSFTRTGPSVAPRAWVILAVLLLLGTSLSACQGERTRGAEIPAATRPAAHAHTEAGETCFICDPSKRDPGRLWCKEHGRYEDRCWLCHPELRDPKRAYCDEHSLYEDECTLCDPSRAGDTPTDDASTATSTGHRHAAGTDTCFICDAAKREPGRLWCKEHGRYEDRCWECHPELRDAERAYCDEHGLYEDECSLCDPSRAQRAKASDAPAEGAHKPELFCNEHQVPELECGICHPQLAGSLPTGESLLIRMASARSADLAGLSIAPPERSDATTSIALLGEIRFDGNRLARVTPLAGGVVAEIHADVGKIVEAGDVLAVVNAPGVAEAKAAYLSALADLELRHSTFDRQRRLFEEKSGPRRAMEEAEALYRRAQVSSRLARQRLANLGFTKRELAAVRSSGRASSALSMRAPFQGTVVSRAAVLGEAVQPGEALFEIADLSEMWIDLSVPEELAARLLVDTRVQVTVRALHGGEVGGRITWVSPVVDERTRMVHARGVLPNPHGALRHGMFAEVSAIVATHAGAVRLPASAVHRVDDQPFVFVRTEPDLFAARRVEIGDRLPTDEYVIHKGVRPDDAIVMTGGFVVKSALLASRLGAGCTDD